MRLERVEIVGFKSFCDKQELSFRGGVTGIVGPNGCGKSNISDAISWVLGEQSVKSLRGSSMEDVIFAGSQSRQPLAMAEVSLKVTGLNGSSPDGSGECLVTRRLYRNGESEYLLNGQVCRLRDIHELFMDTGLGSKAYSIIEQGKIGLILSSKPADRRALIEEAAGITKYKVRRRQTSLKLEAAQQNLLRVNDIVHEVEKQLDSLKRQAGKARRYRRLREEMQAVQRRLFGLRQRELRERAGSLGDRLTAEAERERAASLAVDTEEARLEARRQEHYGSEEALEKERAALASLTMAVDRHQARSGHCQEQIGEAARRRAEASREAEELQARLGPLTSTLQARGLDGRRLEAERAAAEEEVLSAERALQEAAAAQAAAEAAQERARGDQLEAIGRMAALQNARESVAGSAERAGADLLKLAAERSELERERSRVAAQREEAAARGAEARARLAELGTAREAAAAEARAARERGRGLEAAAEALQSERDGAAGRLSSLEEMVATHSAFDEGVRALLAEGPALGVQGVVADALETESAHERAVEAFLGDRLQAVLVPGTEAAVRCLRLLAESGAGRASCLPLDAPAAPSDGEGLLQGGLRRPGAVGLLSAFYTVGGPHAEGIRAAMPDAIVFENLKTALAARAALPGLSCATLSGEVLRGRLVEGGRGVKGLLAPRREVREIAVRLAALDDRLSALREEARGETARAEQAEARSSDLQQAVHEQEKRLVAVGHDLLAADEEQGRLDRKAAVLETERSQAEQERGQAAVRLAEIEQALRAAESERASGTERLAALAADVALCRGRAEAAQNGAAAVRTSLAALRERVAAAEAERARLTEEHRELEQRIAGALARVADSDARAAELAEERREAERLLAQALADRDRAGERAARAEDRVRELRAELEARESALKERRRERDMLKDALAEVEVERARTGADLDHLARECRQAVGVSPEEAAATLVAEDLARDPAGLEQETAELRERIDRLGPVNVLAVEQAQELEGRLSFLTVQRQDLTDSISELEQAIRKIDRTSRERFREAFQAINARFGEVFKQLFGGGTAGLSLLDETELLESGIEVMAQPPGKRLQNVMLLSGGEKALTAIALLFAIFHYKPSPFCILDEVDAPLDDANIGRFVRMLDALKDQTQFVLITHSRRTMEIADQLYGVTMEEPGVSKLVSVRFG